MARDIEETPLPGVGVRYSFDASTGAKITVLHHHSGRHQLFIGSAEDPDSSSLVCEMDDEDVHTLGELLGTSRVVREIDRLQQSVAGLSIEWLTVPAESRGAGQTIGDLELRSTTGVTVVAALREGAALPVPGPDFLIEGGDTLVVMGPPKAIRRADALLRG